MGEASASELNPEPVQDLKGDAWAGCYVLILAPILIQVSFISRRTPGGRGAKSIVFAYFDLSALNLILSDLLTSDLLTLDLLASDLLTLDILTSHPLSSDLLSPDLLTTDFLSSDLLTLSLSTIGLYFNHSYLPNIQTYAPDGRRPGRVLI